MKAAFAVDAWIEAFEEALGRNADFLIVHYGHFWDFHNTSITGWAKERMKILIAESPAALGRLLNESLTPLLACRFPSTVLSRSGVGSKTACQILELCSRHSMPQGPPLP